MGVRDELWGNGQVFTAKGARGGGTGGGERRNVKSKAGMVDGKLREL